MSRTITRSATRVSAKRKEQTGGLGPETPHATLGRGAATFRRPQHTRTQLLHRARALAGAGCNEQECGKARFDEVVSRHNERDLKAVEDSYGTDILILKMSCRYIERLENGRVERHLTKH